MLYSPATHFWDFSDSEAHCLHGLSKKDKIYSSKLSQQDERFQKELSEKEETLQKSQLETQELSHVPAWSGRQADQVQNFKKNKESRMKQRGPLYPKEDNAQPGGSCFTAQQLMLVDVSDFEVHFRKIN